MSDATTDQAKLTRGPECPHNDIRECGHEASGDAIYACMQCFDMWTESHHECRDGL